MAVWILRPLQQRSVPNMVLIVKTFLNKGEQPEWIQSGDEYRMFIVASSRSGLYYNLGALYFVM